MQKSSQIPIKCSSQKNSKELLPKFKAEWSSLVKSMSMSDVETPLEEKIKTTKEEIKLHKKTLKKLTTLLITLDTLSGEWAKLITNHTSRHTLKLSSPRSLKPDKLTSKQEPRHLLKKCSETLDNIPFILLRTIQVKELWSTPIGKMNQIQLLPSNTWSKVSLSSKYDPVNHLIFKYSSITPSNITLSSILVIWVLSR